MLNSIYHSTVRLIGMIFLAMLSFQILAQEQTTFFSNLSAKDGLPSNIIAAIEQDQYDFIWIGTGSGLARYDGYQFRIFKKSDSENSLPSNELNTLLNIGDFLWVGSWNGLCKVNTRTFEITRINLSNHKVIRSLCRGTDSTIWVGTGDGLINYDFTEDTFQEYTSENSGLSHNMIRTIYQEGSRKLWVGTYDGLNLVDLETGKSEIINLNIQQKSPGNHLILDIKPAFKNRLWIGTETGLYLLNTLTKEAKFYGRNDAVFSNDVIKCIYPSETGNLWLGTDFGLNIFNPQTGENNTYFNNPQLPYSIANNVIWQIFEDRSGLIWLVTSNGLSKVNKEGDFYNYQDLTFEVNGQPIGNQVKTVLSSKSGDLWFGTQRGVVKIDPKTQSQKVFDTDTSNDQKLLLNNVFALEEDQKGRIWIGTAGGINVWDQSQQKMYQITANSENGLQSNYIARFATETDGTMWVSAWEGGVYRISGRVPNLRFTQVNDLTGSEKMVYGNGKIWVIALDNLYEVDSESLEKKQIIDFNTGVDKQMIYSLFFSSKGTLWAGTNNGLIGYNSQTRKSTFYRLQSGGDLIVSSISEGQSENIWCTTIGTLYKINPISLQQEVFPLAEGLPLKSFYYNCATSSSDGKIIFGGDNGHIVLSPEHAQPADFNPKVYISGIEINNEDVSIGKSNNPGIHLNQDIAFTKSLILDYDQRSVTFEFSSLHFWQSKMNVYEYRLKGLDETWNMVSGQKNFAVYSSLPPGDYEFQVRATNNFGQESTNNAALSLHVKPPIYFSTGFIISYFLIAGILVFYALRFYSVRVHLKNELKITRMEKHHAEELERTKEQFFTNISHELRTPISLILPPIHEVQKRSVLDPESKNLISLAEKNSIRLLRLVNQILDFNKLENESLQMKISEVEIISFLKEICSLFSNQATIHQIDFTFQSDFDHCRVWVDYEKIETVLFNLLSNAFKFTPEGGTITLSVSLSESSTEFDDGCINISLSDTGIGMSREDQEHIFERFYQAKSGKKLNSSSGIGLTLAAEYTKLHHGQLTVESTQGKGSTFNLCIPIGTQHFSREITADSTHMLGNLHEPQITTQSSIEHQEFNIQNIDLPKVLIVEDNDDIIEFIRTSLSHKFQFIVAPNGKEGQIKAQEHNPEVIISDVMMPIMDGFELCDFIKSNPETSHIMVILLTAKSLPTNRLEGIKRGADVYLTKPFEIDLLEAHLNNLLKRKKELTNYFRSELITNQEQPTTKDNQDNRFLKNVMDIIEANIGETEFNVEDLSDQLGMSSTHLYRRLKALTNHSAQDIIRKYRLKKASLLLQNNEGNVSEIMRQVGFSTQSYFSKCFKEEYHMSPKAFQKQSQENNLTTENPIT